MNRRLLAIYVGVLLLLTGTVTLAFRSVGTVEAETGEGKQIVIAKNPVEEFSAGTAAETAAKTEMSTTDNSGEKVINSTPVKKTAKATSTIGKVAQKPQNTQKPKNTQKSTQQKSTTRKKVASRNSAGFDANKVIRYALTLKGTSYKSGGTTPDGFDCSGFTMYVFKNSVGISLPHSSSAQSEMGTALGRDELVPGALVYFNTSGNGVSHVGIYIGDNKFIDSSNSKGVAVNSLNDKYWGSRYMGARLVK